jgi:hypothetical protein
MTISELIVQLEAFKEKHGDIQVTVMDEYGDCLLTEVTASMYHDEEVSGEWHKGALLS